MKLAHPEALLLLILVLVPVLALALRRRLRRSAIGFPVSAELARLRPSLAARLHAALPWLRALIVALAVLALAGPQWGVETTTTLREGIAVALVVDISSSMSAIDLRLADKPSSRLEVVKATLRDFVAGRAGGLDGRAGDAIAMITFARYADIISPPTLDHEALLALLDQVDIVETPPEDGTAIGDAMVRAVDLLEEVDGSTVIILLTDGSYNAGEAEPLVAAQIAAAYEVSRQSPAESQWSHHRIRALRNARQRSHVFAARRLSAGRRPALRFGGLSLTILTARLRCRLAMATLVVNASLSLPALREALSFSPRRA